MKRPPERAGVIDCSVDIMTITKRVGVVLAGLRVLRSL
jgi:hypothetical protein